MLITSAKQLKVFDKSLYMAEIVLFGKQHVIFKIKCGFYFYINSGDCLCGPVVRVPAYRSGFDSHQIF
jgi:hypothetical protein